MSDKTPEAGLPQNVQVTAQMDLAKQLCTFSETSVNGIIMLHPKSIAVPLQSILVIAAQATLAMMGIQAGQASTVKGPGPGPEIQGRDKLTEM